MLRNRAIVWGRTNPVTKEVIFAEVSRVTPWNYDSNDERTVVIANSGIGTQANADKIANDLLEEFAKITTEVVATLVGSYNLNIADTVYVKSEYYSGLALVTTITSEMSSDGLITRVILGERCPRLVATVSWNDYTPGEDGQPIYAATNGGGVYYKGLYSTTWSSLNSGLGTDLNIIDLDIANSNIACVSSTGIGYYSPHAWLVDDFYWDDFNLSKYSLKGVPSPIMDENDEPYGTDELNCVACSVSRITGKIWFGYNHKTLDRSWVVGYNPGALGIDAYLVNYEESYNVTIIDIDAESGILYISCNAGSWVARNTQDIIGLRAVEKNETFSAADMNPANIETTQVRFYGDGTGINKRWVVSDDEYSYTLYGWDTIRQVKISDGSIKTLSTTASYGSMGYCLKEPGVAVMLVDNGTEDFELSLQILDFNTNTITDCPNSDFVLPAGDELQVYNFASPDIAITKNEFGSDYVGAFFPMIYTDGISGLWYKAEIWFYGYNMFSHSKVLTTVFSTDDYYYWGYEVLLNYATGEMGTALIAGDTFAMLWEYEDWPDTPYSTYGYHLVATTYNCTTGTSSWDAVSHEDMTDSSGGLWSYGTCNQYDVITGMFYYFPDTWSYSIYKADEWANLSQVGDLGQLCYFGNNNNFGVRMTSGGVLYKTIDNTYVGTVLNTGVFFRGDDTTNEWYYVSLDGSTIYGTNGFEIETGLSLSQARGVAFQLNRFYILEYSTGEIWCVYDPDLLSANTNQKCILKLVNISNTGDSTWLFQTAITKNLKLDSSQNLPVVGYGNELKVYTTDLGWCDIPVSNYIATSRSYVEKSLSASPFLAITYTTISGGSILIINSSEIDYNTTINDFNSLITIGSGLIHAIEMSNYSYSGSPFMFYSTSGYPSQFYQRNKDSLTWNNYSSGLPSNNITVIRVDNLV